MPRGYKRNWFAVETNILDNPKWMDLSWEQKGKWLTVRALAERQPIYRFTSRAHLGTLLRKEGDDDPYETIEMFLAARWLDESDDGTIGIHDRSDYLPRLETDSEKRPKNLSGSERSHSVANGRSTIQDKTDITYTARAPASREGGGAREGMSLKDILEASPDLPAFLRRSDKETTNGKNGAAGPGIDHGASRNGVGQGGEAHLGGVRRGEVAEADDVPGGTGPEPQGAG